MEFPGQLVRSEASYVNNSERFLLKEKQFQRQYAHLYASRLWTMKTKLQEAAIAKWGGKLKCRKTSELSSDEHCFLVGTLFKHMPLKPSILKEIGEEYNLMPQPVRDKYTDPSDQLILEDELQRITLTGNVDEQAEVTGTVVAVYGLEKSESPGKFFVKEMIYQAFPPQAAVPTLKEDKYIIFVSGLEIGKRAEDMLHLNMLVDLITGQLGDDKTQSLMSKVVRVIIAGNSLSRSTKDKEQASRPRYLLKRSTPGTKEALSLLDDILVQLCSCIDVDLMPGEFDPTTFTLPQQPLHRCLLPQAAKLESLHCVTNPVDFSIDGVQILGSSGQPVQDIYKFSSLEDHLEILEKTLTVGHLAPTAPDTLGCYPYPDQDPFILSQCPHIYFSGNAPSFGQKLYQGPNGQNVLLLTTPKFSDTFSCVLVNLRTFECRPIVINGKSFTNGKA